MTHDWWRDALCAQTDPGAFYPDSGESTLAAKRICALCPVRVECRDEALATGEQWGVWGGLSETDRRRPPAEHDTTAA